MRPLALSHPRRASRRLLGLCLLAGPQLLACSEVGEANGDSFFGDNGGGGGTDFDGSGTGQTGGLDGADADAGNDSADDDAGSDADADAGSDADADADAGDTGDDDTGDDDTGDDGGFSGQPGTCPPGELAVGYDGTTLDCASVDAATRAAVNQGCRVFLGWRDSCQSCTLPPDRVGFTGGSTCTLINGVNSGCVSATLDGQSLQLMGINMNGDVDENDRFYVGLDCLDLPVNTGSDPASCPAGQVMIGLDPDTGALSCRDLASVASAYTRTRCDLAFGWRDSCGTCTNGPSRAGVAGNPGCNASVLPGNGTCTVQSDGAVDVTLYGLNTGGDVDDNDRFYAALACGAGTPASDDGVSGQCPAGMGVTAVAADGSLSCAALESPVADYVRQSCHLYFGWRDSCNDCTLPPTKWGTATAAACGAVGGSGARCDSINFGASPRNTINFDTDGDVGGDDKFYLGFACR